MYKALKSFSGLVNMTKNEIKEIKDEVIAKDLLKAGYIEKVKEEPKKIKEEIKKITEVPKEEAIKIIEEVKEKIEKPKKKVSKKAKK